MEENEKTVKEDLSAEINENDRKEEKVVESEKIFFDNGEVPVNEENVRFVNDQISKVASHIREEDKNEVFAEDKYVINKSDPKEATIVFNNENARDILAALDEKYAEYDEEEEKKENKEEPLFSDNTYKGKYFVRCPKVDEDKLGESLTELRNNILHKVNTDEECASIGITGAGSETGKTTTAIMLAMSVSTMKRTLLIDCSFPTSNMHKYFNNGNKIGLRNAILGEYDIHQVILNTDIDNLKVITSGHGIKSAEISSEKMLKVIEPLLNEYDVIIFDMGNLNRDPYVAEVCGYLTGNVLMVKKGKNTFKDTQNAAKKIRKYSGVLMGIAVI